MPKLESVEELEALQDQLQKDLSISAKSSTTITVGMGTCGISAGAREVMRVILEQLEERGIEVRVRTVGCIGMCAKEPLIDVQQGGEPRITYGNVKPEMVPRIIEEHLMNGQVVDDWVVGRVPTRWGEADG
jgi:NADP-reducing hydrogenase subunit HndB